MTLNEFLLHGDPGDSFAFVGYYIPSLLAALFAFLVPGAILFLWGASTRKYISLLIISVICFWGIYFISTASRNMTLATLGSESAGAAEFAYQKSFDLNLYQAIKLAVGNTGFTIDETGAQNVRFYAACRVADILASSNQDFRNVILGKIRDAPIVTPGFIGTNSINCPFYIDGRAQPRLDVAEIVQRRLQNLDRTRSNAGITSSVP